MQIPMCTKDLRKREYPFFSSFHWGAAFIQQLNMILWWNCYRLWCRVVTCKTFWINNNTKLKILHHLWIIKSVCETCPRVCWHSRVRGPCNRYWYFHPPAEPWSAIRLFKGTWEHLKWHHDVLIVLIRRGPDQFCEKSNKARKCARKLLAAATAPCLAADRFLLRAAAESTKYMIGWLSGQAQDIRDGYLMKPLDFNTSLQHMWE